MRISSHDVMVNSCGRLGEQTSDLKTFFVKFTYPDQRPYTHSPSLSPSFSLERIQFLLHNKRAHQAEVKRALSRNGVVVIALASHQWIRSDEGLTLEMSAFRISVRWPIYIINSVDRTKFLYITSPPTQHHSFFRNYPLLPPMWPGFDSGLVAVC